MIKTNVCYIGKYLLYSELTLTPLPLGDLNGNLDQ